jgi:hypothetical protein
MDRGFALACDLHQERTDMAKPAGSYGPTAKAFHWLIFLLLLAQFTIGEVMPISAGRPWTRAGCTGTCWWAP